MSRRLAIPRDIAISTSTLGFTSLSSDYINGVPVLFFMGIAEFLDTIAAVRWPEGRPRCPFCEQWDNTELWSYERWQCNACRRQFSITSGTIFDRTKIQLGYWFGTLWLDLRSKGRITPNEVCRIFNLKRSQAQKILLRIRKGMEAGKLRPGEGLICLVYDGSDLVQQFNDPDVPRNIAYKARLRIGSQLPTWQGGVMELSCVIEKESPPDVAHYFGAIRRLLSVRIEQIS